MRVLHDDDTRSTQGCETDIWKLSNLTLAANDGRRSSTPHVSKFSDTVIGFASQAIITADYLPCYRLLALMMS